MQQTSDKVMKGNSVPMNNTVTNTQPIGEFAGFRPEALQRIANTVGYTGDMNGFDAYLSQNPEAQQRMQYYTEAARKMAKGGMVKKYAAGGLTQNPQYQLAMNALAQSNPSLYNTINNAFNPPQTQTAQPSSTNQAVYQALSSLGPQALQAYQQATGTYQPPATQSQPTINQQIASQMGGMGSSVLNLLNQYYPQGAGQTTNTYVPASNSTTATNVASKSSGSTPPNYQAFLNSPQYKQALTQASSQVITPVTIGGQTYNFGNPVMAQAYQNFAASQQSTTPTTTSTTTPTTTSTTTPTTTPQTASTTTPTTQTTSTTRTSPTALSQQYIPQQNFAAGATLPEVQKEIATKPGLPAGATMVPAGVTLEQAQLVSPASGQVAGTVALPTAQALTSTSATPQAMQAAQAQVQQVAPDVSNALQTLQAAQGTVDPRAEILAAQQTASSVGNVQAAQGNSILINNPVQRQIEAGELVSGAADAATASAFAEQIQAATATPSKQATVAGQLETLMQQFQGGATPPWAAGAMRNAMATLSARGLGASSMAGQAVIQATMEAALPIAQADANVMASFEAQNLSNRQQRAMLAAQQRAQFIGQEFDQAFQARVANAARIGDIANMNFTAEQQIALENSRIANTVNMQNLNNRQALVMAEAAALANMDMANLNNRQQAAVQNAQSFLQMDMANLSNQQQTDLFKAQQRVQSLFTDQAAQNAAAQFNATSQNQVDQFFSSLSAQVSQFNATQANAQSQFNAGQRNTVERFNAEINNQRDQFNAQNRLIIDQSNAQWRREVATADTVAVNRANELNATALLGLSQSAYNNLWQYYRDNMEWAWTSAENERQRVANIAITQLQADSNANIQSMKEDYQSSANFGSAVFKFLTSDLSGSILGGLF